MTQKKTVDVVIAQQRLSLKTDQDPAEVARIADLVNRRLGEITPPGQPVSQQVLILLAMNLAGEVLKLQENDASLRADVKQRSQTILTQLEKEFPI